MVYPTVSTSSSSASFAILVAAAIVAFLALVPPLSSAALMKGGGSGIRGRGLQANAAGTMAMMMKKKTKGCRKLKGNVIVADCAPTQRPTLRKRTKRPTQRPTKTPLARGATQAPSSHPSEVPTAEPSTVPSPKPSGKPSVSPSAQPSESSSTSPKPSAQPSASPAGAMCDQLTRFRTNGHRYMVSPMGPSYAAFLNYVAALPKCCGKKGHLVTITNETEQAFVEDLQYSNRVTAGWIGFNDFAQDEVYQWVTGEAVSYTNWVSGSPIAGAGVQNCVVVDFYADNFKWAQRNCNTNSMRAVLEYDCAA